MEDTSRCGAAGEISMQIYENAFDYLDAPVQRIATKNYPIPDGELENMILPQPRDVVAAVELLMG
jgi:pyruvate dehydrogenase E1 component beta subunit